MILITALSFWQAIPKHSNELAVGVKSIQQWSQLVAAGVNPWCKPDLMWAYDDKFLSLLNMVGTELSSSLVVS